jgi:hypothetical protein
MAKFAANTSVAAERSRMEIELVLKKYGASRFAYVSEIERADIGFEMKERLVRFSVPLPQLADFKRVDDSRVHAGFRIRTEIQMAEACEQAVRQRWRALLLMIRAKLEAVESGIESFDTAFLPYTVVPGTSKTFAEWAVPQIARAYEGGKMPPLLLGTGS